MKWKGPNTKSVAGICKHETVLPLSLKSNWLFGKWSPHQWPKEWPDPCQQGHWGGEKLGSELCHCPEPAWRGPENQAGQKKSRFPGATYKPCSWHTQGKWQGATAGQWHKRTGEATTPDTRRLCQGTGASIPRDPTAGDSGKVHIYCLGHRRQRPLWLCPVSLALPRKLRSHFQTQVKKNS